MPLLTLLQPPHPPPSSPCKSSFPSSSCSSPTCQLPSLAEPASSNAHYLHSPSPSNFLLLPLCRHPRSCQPACDSLRLVAVPTITSPWWFRQKLFCGHLRCLYGY
ncbi:hypothetical protein IF2G_11129 [Cordyceps javanica]|nr:hypothetical protein IF2G_11129 [Cordyceps javanica]